MAMAPDPLGRASRCPWHRVLVHPHGPAGPGPMADRRREDLACGSALGREGSHREKASPHTGPGAPELACAHPGHHQFLLDYRLARGRALAPADHETARYELLRGRLGLSPALCLR